VGARLPPGLVALTPGDLAAGGARELARRVRIATDAGLRGVVLREPDLPDRAFLELALELRALLAPERGGWLCLHDRPHLAAAAAADAVHLGARSLPIADVRAWLAPDIAPDIALGLSTHAGDDPASWRDADYLFHGPVLPTSKPGARPAIRFEGLARAAASTDRPIWALGGLSPEHVAPSLAAGARGIAVLSGLLPRPDAAVRCIAYLRELGAPD
jgi:thiamine-phosphate pyrophosphorylase